MVDKEYYFITFKTIMFRRNLLYLFMEWYGCFYIIRSRTKYFFNFINPYPRVPMCNSLQAIWEFSDNLAVFIVLQINVHHLPNLSRLWKAVGYHLKITKYYLR